MTDNRPAEKPVIEYTWGDGEFSLNDMDLYCNPPSGEELTEYDEEMSIEDPCPKGGRHHWRASEMYTDEVHSVPSATCTKCDEERI